MKSSAKVFIVVAIIVVIFVFMGMGQYNRMVALDEKVKAQWGQVENQLQRRADLVPNLVTTVKGYASHESSVLTAVTEARARVGSAQTVPDKIAANQELTSALARLLVVVENYPNLKANQNFLDLQAQLEGTENRISQERRLYNEAVMQYNTALRRFPGVIIARLTGFTPKTPFEAGAQAKNAPEVKF